MLCPRCETPCDTGARACPGCGATLPEARPAAGIDTSEDLVPVFETADSALLPILKSVLYGAGIPHVVQGDRALSLLPMGPFGIGVHKGVLGAIILVPGERAEEARDLLLHIPGGSQDEDQEPG